MLNFNFLLTIDIKTWIILLYHAHLYQKVSIQYFLFQIMLQILRILLFCQVENKYEKLISAKLFVTIKIKYF